LNWEELFAAIRKFLLVDSAKQVPLCKTCHEAQHTLSHRTSAAGETPTHKP